MTFKSYEREKGKKVLQVRAARCRIDSAFFVMMAAVCGVAIMANVAFGQQMQFSIYQDSWFTGGGLSAMGYTNVIDNSWGCTHSNYQTTLRWQSPTGRSVTSQTSGLSTYVSISIDGENGIFGLITTGSYNCSCSGLNPGFGSGLPVEIVTAAVTTYFSTPTPITGGCLYANRIGTNCACGYHNFPIVPFSQPCSSAARCEFIYGRMTVYNILWFEACTVGLCIQSGITGACDPKP
jgi:hypothetical protein